MYVTTVGVAGKRTALANPLPKSGNDFIVLLLYLHTPKHNNPLLFLLCVHYAHAAHYLKFVSYMYPYVHIQF
jgi:hypothetical protein